MQEIQDLQKLLQDTYNKTYHTLSNKIITSILLKLPTLGLKLFHTQDACQYYTEKELHLTIQKQVQCFGRISVLQLSRIINLNMQVVNRCCSCVGNNNDQITRIKDELFSKGYMESIRNRLLKVIEDHNLVSIGQFADREQISVQFINNMIGKQFMIENKIFKLQNWLIADIYEQQLKAKIKGCLRGVRIPTNINTLIKRWNFIEVLSMKVVKNLLLNKQVEGSFKHQLIFIPKMFIQQQQKNVRVFFQANGYLDYSILTNTYYVENPQSLAESLFKKECLFTQQGCIAYSKIEEIRQPISELLKQQGYVELLSYLPQIFSQEQMQSVLQNRLKLRNTIYHSKYLFDRDWINLCLKSLQIRVLFNIIYEEQGKVKGKGKPKKKKIISSQQLITILLQNQLLKYQNKGYYPEQELFQIIYRQLEEIKNRFQTQLYKFNSFVQINGIKFFKRQKQHFIDFLSILSNYKSRQFFFCGNNIIQQLSRLVKQNNQIVQNNKLRVVGLLMYILNRLQKGNKIFLKGLNLMKSLLQKQEKMLMLYLQQKKSRVDTFEQVYNVIVLLQNSNIKIINIIQNYQEVLQRQMDSMQNMDEEYIILKKCRGIRQVIQIQ